MRFGEVMRNTLGAPQPKDRLQRLRFRVERAMALHDADRALRDRNALAAADAAIDEQRGALVRAPAFRQLLLRPFPVVLYAVDGSVGQAEWMRERSRWIECGGRRVDDLGAKRCDRLSPFS